MLRLCLLPALALVLLVPGAAHAGVVEAPPAAATPTSDCHPVPCTINGRFTITRSAPGGVMSIEPVDGVAFNKGDSAYLDLPSGFPAQRWTGLDGF